MKPPRLARALVRRAAPPHLRDSFLDDLDELFAASVARLGHRRARAWYWGQALVGLPRLLAIRRRPTLHSHPGEEV